MQNPKGSAGAKPVNRTEIPPLMMGDLRIEALGMPVIVVWGNLGLSRFFTLPAAKAAINAEMYLSTGSPRSRGAKIFVWDGVAWANADL
jgi:hypothetical protein